MLVKSSLIWVGILVLAIVNGVIREAVLIPQIGQIAGLIVSGVTLSVAIIGVAYITLPWLGAKKTTSLLIIGLSWLILTVVFEFSFGLLQGKSLSTLLQAYRFKGGNIWPIVLLITATAPYLAAKLRA